MRCHARGRSRRGAGGPGSPSARTRRLGRLARRTLSAGLSETDGELPPVRFERDALLQVLLNLIDNAVKYTGEGDGNRIVLCLARDGDGVRIVVRGHGPGVPERHLAHVFEPFYRGERELPRRSKETGLGLALVRGLVERMGGRVAGRNGAGGGFEVTIALAGRAT